MSTQEIQLTRGFVALVDQEDLDRALEAGPWFVQIRGRSRYARHNFWSKGGKYGALMLHQLIAGCLWVDHINGDGLDNRRANLRAATRSQNGGNRRLNLNNKSGFKGVHLSTEGRWLANVSAGGQRRYLGSFDSAIEAAKAYDSAALELFGEFARINFPEDQK